MSWPPWWDWDLELTAHLERRMEDRSFTESDLRRMLEDAHTRSRDDAMNDRYLEVTYQKGKPLAAYLYLPRPAGARSARTEPAPAGLLVDYDSDGTPIGIENTAPSLATPEQLNLLLRRLGLPAIASEELAPLQAA